MADDTRLPMMSADGPAYAKALAHPFRHRLLLELGHEDSGGATVSQLANRLAVNKGNVAHHLGVLQRAGLVRHSRSRTVRGGTEQYFVRATRQIEFGEAGLPAMMSNLTEEFAADPDGLLNHRVLRLTARQADALAAHLDRLVNELEPAGPREQAYGVVVGVYRRT